MFLQWLPCWVKPVTKMRWPRTMSAGLCCSFKQCFKPYVVLISIASGTMNGQKTVDYTIKGSCHHQSIPNLCVDVCLVAGLRNIFSHLELNCTFPAFWPSLPGTDRARYTFVSECQDLLSQIEQTDSEDQVTFLTRTILCEHLKELWTYIMLGRYIQRALVCYPEDDEIYVSLMCPSNIHTTKLNYNRRIFLMFLFSVPQAAAICRIQSLIAYVEDDKIWEWSRRMCLKVAL